MKIELTITGSRPFEEVTTTTVTKEVNSGDGVRFLATGTRFSVTGQIEQIDEANRRMFIASESFRDWVDFDAIRDIIPRDDHAWSELKNQIDYGEIKK